MTAENEDLAIFQNSELFSNLSQKELNFVISRSGVFNLAKNNLLFSSGEKARHFYILIRGAIRVYKPREDEGQDEMAVYGEGDSIGDFDFARGAEYDAFAEAAEDAKLIIFPDKELTMDSLAREEPGIVCRILLNAIVLMTGRIKSVNRLILENMVWVQELHRRVYEDSGTGLWKQSLIKDEIIGALKAPTALIMLKPDRFKILVDSRGHSAGDEAMVRIALILKNITRSAGHGWALRFKSNETGLIFKNFNEQEAEKTALELSQAIKAMEPVAAQGDIPEFFFSATISWSLWPADDPDWDSLFQGNYKNLLDTWRTGGGTITRYRLADITAGESETA